MQQIENTITLVFCGYGQEDGDLPIRQKMTAPIQMYNPSRGSSMRLRGLSILVLIFFSIYWITLPIFSNSLFVIFILVLAISRGWITVELARTFKDPVFFCLGLAMTMSILFTTLIATASESFDFSYSFLLARQLPYILAAIGIGVFVARQIGSLHRRPLPIEDYMLTAGCLQGLIVLCALVNPEFRLALLPFQGSEKQDFLLSAGNLGIRGLALAAQQFFGLASMLCIQTAIIAGWALKNSSIRNTYFYIRFLIFGIACLLVGRTSGLCFVLLLMLIIAIENTRAKAIFFLSLTVVAVTISIYFDANDPLLAWAFEPFVNFFNGDGFTSVSTSNLSEDMLFMPTLPQLTFGDGIYTATDGFYYRDTDSGLLRPILFGGIILLLLEATPYLASAYFKKASLANCPGRSMSIYLAIIVILILQIKGEIFLTGTMSNVLFFFYLACISSDRLKQSDTMPMPAASTEQDGA